MWTLLLCCGKPSVQMQNESSYLAIAWTRRRTGCVELWRCVCVTAEGGRLRTGPVSAWYRRRQPHGRQRWNPGKRKPGRPVAHHDELHVLLRPPAELVAHLEDDGLHAGTALVAGPRGAVPLAAEAALGGVEAALEGPAPRGLLEQERALRRLRLLRAQLRGDGHVDRQLSAASFRWREHDDVPGQAAKPAGAAIPVVCPWKSATLLFTSW
mmetsp:Transcript_55608/g.162564  ORF Transcript_55608/g.162564 Transcript_55608/m.162564 type:complete len:211 (+) Transcript_55608:238-870(+)